MKLTQGTQGTQGAIASGDITLGPARVPVVHHADVVVIGGGPGGFAAALRAARAGASTLLIEKYDMPGGVHTVGLQGAAGRGVGGIHTELMERFAQAGCIYTVTEADLPDWAGNPLSHYEAYLQPGSRFERSSFNPEGAGCVMVKMLEEAGVKALYGASFVEVVVEKGAGGERRIQAAIIETASGAQAAPVADSGAEVIFKGGKIILQVHSCGADRCVQVLKILVVGFLFGFLLCLLP